MLDEPTSALDPELEAGVLRVLLALAQEEDSMIIVTHNMEFARAVAKLRESHYRHYPIVLLA
ncbi:hypothetical protein WP50_15130 [Lactiplantibacillus plantarum]|nr:hypothetical protein WP50_15130 [Lactiplantibacillus plantarum]